MGTAEADLESVSNHPKPFEQKVTKETKAAQTDGTFVRFVAFCSRNFMACFNRHRIDLSAVSVIPPFPPVKSLP
jgi:hypothetical protein